MGYASVIVGTDGSTTAEQAVRAAAELAGGARLLVVTAFRGTGTPGSDEGDGRPIRGPERRAEAEHLAEQATALARAAGAVRAEARTGEGPAAAVLLGLADEHGTDLIVVGSLGMTGASRFVLGGVANDVTHSARCDVLVVHTGG